MHTTYIQQHTYIVNTYNIHKYIKHRHTNIHSCSTYIHTYIHKEIRADTHIDKQSNIHTHRHMRPCSLSYIVSSSRILFGHSSYVPCIYLSNSWWQHHNKRCCVILRKEIKPQDQFIDPHLQGQFSGVDQLHTYVIWFTIYILKRSRGY